MNKKTSPWSFADLISLVIAVLLFATFLAMPWLKPQVWFDLIRTNFAYAGLTGETLGLFQGNVSLLVLLAIASVGGALASVWGLFSARNRRISSLLVLAAGLIGVIYAGLYVVQAHPRFINPMNLVTSSFWLSLALCVLLIAQIVFPRPLEDSQPMQHGVYTTWWWLVILIVLGIVLYYNIWQNGIYASIFDQLKEGVSMTLRVAFTAYLFAAIIGLIVGLIRANVPVPPKPGIPTSGVIGTTARMALYNLATLYVEVLRGLPILVIILIAAFVLVPDIRDSVSQLTGLDLSAWRGSSAESAIVALAFVYGAFMSETFRAGIQSVDKGQIEAARSLGMNYYLLTRFIVLPQGIRRVLPPLGNDMVSMIKDSSLVAILGVRDITQIAKTSSGQSFRYPETYLVVAVLYLTLTVTGSLLVRYIEGRLKQTNVQASDVPDTSMAAQRRSRVLGILWS